MAATYSPSDTQPLMSAPIAVASFDPRPCRETIARSDAELVLIGTPIDLRRVIDLDKPALRVTYSLQELGEPTLASILESRGIIKPAHAFS